MTGLCLHLAAPSKERGRASCAPGLGGPFLRCWREASTALSPHPSLGSEVTIGVQLPLTLWSRIAPQ